jgi:AAA+ ATPase superfamily predicted ATPase
MSEYRLLQGGQEDRQIGGYLKSLIEKFQIIEMRLPIFAVKGTSRKSRYYITDNFLLSWLGAIDRQIKTARVRPVDICISTCSSRLETLEGVAFEKLIRMLIEELSRSGHPDFQITTNITGFWNRSEEIEKSVEIDLIYLNEDQGWVRFGSCKRSADKLIKDAKNYDRHIEYFLKTKEGRAFSQLKKIKTAFAPHIDSEQRTRLSKLGYESVALFDLIDRLD